MLKFTEKELQKLYQENKDGDLHAREKIVRYNLPLVHAICKRYPTGLTEYDDLFQEGCIGLLKALQNYDPDKGIKFSTYAVPFILGEIKSFLRRNGHLLKVSRSYHEHYQQLLKNLDHLQQKFKRQPHVEELAERMGLPKEEVAWLMELQYPVLSLQEESVHNSMGREKVGSFDSEDLVNRILLQEKLSALSSRERQVIVLRYFLEQSQEKVAHTLGISQSYVSRIERQIIRNLKESN